MSYERMIACLHTAAHELTLAEAEAASTTGQLVPGEEFQQDILQVRDKVLALVTASRGAKRCAQHVTATT